MDLKSESVLLPWDSTPIPMTTSVENFSNLPETQNCIRKDFSEVLDINFSTSNPLYLNNSTSTNQSFPQEISTKIEDIQYWIVAAFVLILLRRLVEKYIFIPLGRRLGIKEISKNQTVTCRIPSALPTLETAYFSGNKKFSDKCIEKVSLETGLNSREIQYWLRKRRALDRPSVLIKFSESGWRFVCYIMSTSIGIWALSDKPWVWDMELLWADYPNHNVPFESWLYYLYGSGLYLSFLLTQAFDIKRKDFWEMFVHHIVTLILLGLSWSQNLTRIGLYTLLLHDCADIFLEAAKMAIYTKKQDLSTEIFVIFTLVWIITRLIIYPINVVIGSAYYMLQLEDLPRPFVYTVTALLTALFGLHVFWTYFICKVAISAIKSGSEKHKDTRSSTEESDSDTTNETEIPSASSSELNKGKLNFVKNEERTFTRRFSLQNENAAQILAVINLKQRAIMKRISIEIMEN